MSLTNLIKKFYTCIHAEIIKKDKHFLVYGVDYENKNSKYEMWLTWHGGYGKEFKMFTFFCEKWLLFGIVAMNSTECLPCYRLIRMTAKKDNLRCGHTIQFSVRLPTDSTSAAQESWIAKCSDYLTSFEV